MKGEVAGNEQAESAPTKQIDADHIGFPTVSLTENPSSIGTHPKENRKTGMITSLSGQTIRAFNRRRAG